MTGKPDRIPLSFNHPGGGYNHNRRSIRVDREKFNKFPVFDTVKFTIKGGKPTGLLEFKIPNIKPIYYYHTSSDKITGAEIIYSKSNPHQPLVFSINTNSKTSYYKQRSVTDRDYFNVLADRHSGDVADALIEENDDLNGRVTFRVDKKQKYNNIGLVQQRDIGGYYKEYTHTPRSRGGVNTRNALVVNNVDGINLKINFTGSKIKIQDKKLESISVYFFDFGVQKEIPLMIKVNMDSNQHFYTPTTGHDETWVKVDPKDFSGGTDNRVITNYLSKIKKLLFETVYVLIHKQEHYKMLTVDDPKTSKGIKTKPDAKREADTTLLGPEGDGPGTKAKTKGGRKGRKVVIKAPSNLNPKNTITVSTNKCATDLDDYVCFQHNLTVHKDPTQDGHEEHQTGHGTPKNITAYISNVPINIHILLPGGFAGYMGVPSDNTMSKADFILLQNRLNLNVFFYRSGDDETEERIDVDTGTNSGQNTNPNPKQGIENKSRVDNIPLMFNYYKHWFKPRSVDEYFGVWTIEAELADADPCNPKDAPRIKKHLDAVNRMLNRINLHFNMDKTTLNLGSKNLGTTQGPGTTSQCSGQYGITPTPSLNKSYDVSRILVTCEPFYEDPMFISYTHKTKNGSSIGVTYYRTMEKDARVGGGPTRVASTSIGQGKYSHTQSSDNTYCTNQKDRCIKGFENDLDGSVDVQAKSVTAYYFNEDTFLNYPLLTQYVLPNNKYKYYVLKHC